jgi:hypothetical protein
VLRGYVVPEQADQLVLRVKVPGKGKRVRAWAGAQSVEHTVEDGFVVFTVPGTAGTAADWAVTW